MSSANALQNYDRRCSPRTDINSPATIKYEDTETTVEMLNISNSGICIASAEAIECQQLTVIMESQDGLEAAIEITAEIVRSEHLKEAGCHLYGCEIRNVSGF